MKSILFLSLVAMAPMVELPQEKPTSPGSSRYPDLVERWNAAQVRSEWVGKVSRTVRKAKAQEWRYEPIAKACGMPVEVLAALHNLESGGRFDRHAHEGSSLRQRTRWIPKGRPVEGAPPFTFHESAVDAYRNLKQSDKVDWGDLGAWLYWCEGFNGYGYRKYRNINSPYIDSGLLSYSKGKYVADGKYDPQSVSKQVGVIAFVKHWRGELF